MSRLTLLVGIAALICAPGVTRAQPPGATQPSAATGNAENGRQLFLAYSCWACHGYGAIGGTGPRLAPSRFATAAGLTMFVRNPPTMPPYSIQVLSDAQVADIWAYLQSLPRPAGAKDIPLLNQILMEK